MFAICAGDFDGERLLHFRADFPHIRPPELHQVDLAALEGPLRALRALEALQQRRGHAVPAQVVVLGRAREVEQDGRSVREGALRLANRTGRGAQRVLLQIPESARGVPLVRVPVIGRVPEGVLEVIEFDLLLELGV